MKKLLPFSFLFFVFILISCSHQDIETQIPQKGELVVDLPTYIVGEKWIEIRQDFFSGKHTKHITIVISVNKDGSYEMLTDIPEFKRKLKFYYDKKGFRLAGIDLSNDKEFPVSKPPRRPVDFPIWVGKKWVDPEYIGWSVVSQKHFKYKNIKEVKSYERIETKAGSFMAFKIYIIHINLETRRRWSVTQWYSPKTKSIVRIKKDYNEYWELIDYIPVE